MGNRRMISKTVTQTQKFLRLPLETQALYFHLIQNTDDDGVVEAFPIVRMIGSSEDSLGLLVIKQFIKPLNDEMVYFIVDFHEQNTVRKDRYVKGKYKELLEEQLGLPNDNQMTTIGLPNISKVNISKGNVIEDIYSPVSTETKDAIPYKEIIDYLNDKAKTKYRASGKKTQSLIKARWKEGFNLDDFKTVIDKKTNQWLHDAKMVEYLRPETLFGTKFESYLNQPDSKKVDYDDSYFKNKYGF